MVSHSSYHDLYPFVVSYLVYNLDKGRVSFGDDFLGDGVDGLVVVRCLR